MAFRTPKIIGRPPARLTKPASIAKIATASRIEVSFLRVEIESGVNENSIVGPIATIFGQEKEQGRLSSGIRMFGMSARLSDLPQMLGVMRAMVGLLPFPGNKFERNQPDDGRSAGWPAW